MRKLVLASALSGAMLSLAACSGAADETAETTDTAEVETIDDAAAAETAAVSVRLSHSSTCRRTLLTRSVASWISDSLSRILVSSSNCSSRSIWVAGACGSFSISKDAP